MPRDGGKFELTSRATADGGTDLRLVLRDRLDRELEDRYVRLPGHYGLGRSTGRVRLGWVESQQHINLSVESAYCGEYASDSFYAMIMALSRISTARCYACALLAIGLCLSVSVCHKSEF